MLAHITNSAIHNSGHSVPVIILVGAALTVAYGVWAYLRKH